MLTLALSWPRNCAEATIKDLGIVCVEAGYDIRVGGNGGIEVRVTDPLVRVATEEEVLEHTGAFLQLYREEAHYFERTAPWIAPVGIAYVKKRLVEDPRAGASFMRASCIPRPSCRRILGRAGEGRGRPRIRPPAGVRGGVTWISSGKISARSTTSLFRARGGSASAIADDRSPSSARARTASSRSSMSVPTAICSCFSVSEAAIRSAIRTKKLTSPAEIATVLRAGTNCGSCVPELKKLRADAAQLSEVA